MGVRLVLDDFGSGQASFSNLSQYPLAMVRFESDFSARARRDGDTAAVTRAMISMVHTLDLGVIVTGVENEAQAALLRDAGCDLVQGAFWPAGVGRRGAVAAVSPAAAARSRLARTRARDCEAV